LVCTVFPIVNKALALYGDKVAKDLSIDNTAPLHHAEIKDNVEDSKKSNFTLNNEEFRNKKIVLASTPQGVTLGSNYKCNADCMFCLGGEYKPFSLKLYKNYFEPKVGIMLNQAEHVSFCGMGELLLIPDIEELLDYINRMMPDQNKIITTNGLVFKDSILERLMQGKYSVQISLHASNPILHSQITGVKQGFERIVKHINYLVSHRKNKQSPYVVLVFLVNTMNIEDLPNFVDLASSLGVDTIQCNYLTIFKPAHLKLSCFFKQEITNEIFDKASQRAEELKIPLVLPPKFSADNNSYFKMICSEPWKNIYVDTEQAVLPCCYSGEHFGELKEADILSIWNNKKYQQLRADLASGDAIKMCKYCLNSNPANVNLLNSHVSFRPDVQKEIFGE
jgi:MoaA/NifB/PqqE/SkfB family radical SAM enzyme